MTNEQLGNLRAIRLWHWRELKSCSRVMRFGTRPQQAIAKAMHSQHLGIVQFLNDFFPIDDTAEKDDAEDMKGRIVK